MVWLNEKYPWSQGVVTGRKVSKEGDVDFLIEQKRGKHSSYFQTLSGPYLPQPRFVDGDRSSPKEQASRNAPRGNQKAHGLHARLLS
jgi:hypothetical protein